MTFELASACAVGALIGVAGAFGFFWLVERSFRRR
jgi:hypothetical protein